ncbi:hypothetical protein [Alkalimarinus alittae]|uniref:Lipoprotein n=1 Tax=Alkalimarinus alittae TaxID=2961619 RepID=A0ABY6N7E7_9ALTE|nr:hypothetical protein [Alkalimarinus alittae]UZE97909.1 hypothetical protein NKI27_09305 [Alkalimarinus alittae]
MKTSKALLLALSILTLAGCSSTIIKTADMLNAEGEAHVCKGKVIGSAISLGNQIIAARNRDACVDIFSKKGFIKVDDIGCYPVIIEMENDKPMVLEAYKISHGLPENMPVSLASINGVEIPNIDAYKQAIFGSIDMPLSFLFDQQGTSISATKKLDECKQTP